MVREARRRGSYRKIVQTIPDVLYEIDREGKFIFVSEAVKIFGYTPEDLEGKKFISVIHPRDTVKVSRKLILPEYKGRSTGDESAPKLFDERRTKKRMTRNMEVRVLAGPTKEKERDFFHVEVHSSGVWSAGTSPKNRKLKGTLGIFRDVTHRKFLERELLRRCKDLAAMVKKNPEGMLVTGKGGEILFVNPSAEKLLGKRSSELTGGIFELPSGGEGQIRVVEDGGGKQEKILTVTSVNIVWEEEKRQLICLRDDTENMALREMFCEASMKDELTGLYNRRAFMVLGGQQMKMSRRKKEYVYLLFADMDELKKINDEFGHHRGDKALCAVADSMRAVFRESDIAARISGDEFVVMGVVSRKEDVGITVSRWKGHISFLNENKAIPFDLSLSIGEICVVPDGKTEIEDLLKQADREMYLQKRKKEPKN